MVIKVQDFEYENLLLHFNNGLDFIKEGLQSGGVVFVHCNAGVSRSASFIIAYLMRELDYEFQTAHDFVKQKRPQVFPNKGFLRQLKQYEYDLLKLKLQQKYQEANANGQEEQKQSVAQDDVLKLLTQHVPPTQIQDADLEEQKQPSTQTLEQKLQSRVIDGQTQVHTDQQVIGKNYSCRKCRMTLFDQDVVEEHISEVKKHNVRRGERYEMSDECSSIFIQHLEWIKIDEEQNKGIIECPKCKAKLGTYTVYGGQCSCGKWNSPAFQIHKSKVDELNKYSTN
eukprot:403360750